MFDRAFVIALERRPERLQRFREQFPTDWPWNRVQTWPAVDGNECKIPAWFKGPPGAWGCLQSHLAIWWQQFEEGWDSVLIFEDDAVFCRDAVHQIKDAIACVPADWDQIYFGGQHLDTNELPPEVAIQDRLVRCRYVNRTHAYAIRLPFAEAAIAAIDRRFETDNARLHHVDYQLGEMHASGQYDIYAPWRFMIGQSSGESDVRNNRRGKPKHVIEHWWNQFPIVEPAGVA